MTTARATGHIAGTADTESLNAALVESTLSDLLHSPTHCRTAIDAVDGWIVIIGADTALEHWTADDTEAVQNYLTELSPYVSGHLFITTDPDTINENPTLFDIKGGTLTRTDLGTGVRVPKTK